MGRKIVRVFRPIFIEGMVDDERGISGVGRLFSCREEDDGGTICVRGAMSYSVGAVVGVQK
jgi:hypothetical protein